MNKKELIDVVADRLGSTKKDAGLVVAAVIDAITEEIVGGGKVSLVGFGVFETVERKERKCRNLQTSEEMTVPAKMSPKFRASKTLKVAVAGLPVGPWVDGEGDDGVDNVVDDGVDNVVDAEDTDGELA